MTVVMIDDEEDDYLLVRDVLKGFDPNYVVEWAPTYEAGLERLKSGQGDIFLVDYSLGARSGLELLEEARSLNVIKPIVFLTGSDRPELDMAAMEKGANYYIQKKQLTVDHLIERTIRYALKSAQDLERSRDADRLRYEKAMAEKEARTKSELLANMSHEIRTPLGAILGFIEIIVSGRADAKKVRAFHRIILKNAKYLVILVNNLLDMSRVEANKFRPQLTLVKWRDVVTDVIKTFSVITEDQNNHLSVVLEENPPAEIMTDENALRQILLNLVGNAMKFTKDGEVRIQVCADERFNLRVVDSGLGMSDEDKEKIFKPFGQGENLKLQKISGTGLGLNLSKHLAKSLGGDLVLENTKLGEGTTFKLTLPLKPTRLDGKRILVIEDNEDNQRLFQFLIEQVGGKVVAFTEGARAIEACSPGQFDAVLLDLQMPGMNGFEVLKALRSKGVKEPIFAISAHAPSEMLDQSIKVGFNGFLTKPFESDQLIQTLMGTRDGKGY